MLARVAWWVWEVMGVGVDFLGHGGGWVWVWGPSTNGSRECTNGWRCLWRMVCAWRRVYSCIRERRRHSWMAVSPSRRRQEDALLEGAAVGRVGELEAVVEQAGSLGVVDQCVEVGAHSTGQRHAVPPSASATSACNCRRWASAPEASTDLRQLSRIALPRLDRRIGFRHRQPTNRCHRDQCAPVAWRVPGFATVRSGRWVMAKSVAAGAQGEVRDRCRGQVAGEGEDMRVEVEATTWTRSRSRGRGHGQDRGQGRGRGRGRVARSRASVMGGHGRIPAVDDEVADDAYAGEDRVERK